MQQRRCLPGIDARQPFEGRRLHALALHALALPGGVQTEINAYGGIRARSLRNLQEPAESLPTIARSRQNASLAGVVRADPSPESSSFSMAGASLLPAAWSERVSNSRTAAVSLPKS